MNNLPNEIIEHILTYRDLYVLTSTNIELFKNNLGIYHIEYQAKKELIKYALKNIWVPYYLPCYRIERILIRDLAVSYIDTWDTTHNDFTLGYKSEDYHMEIWRQNVIMKPKRLIFDFDTYLKDYIEANELSTEQEIKSVLNKWSESIPLEFLDMFKEQKTKYNKQLDKESMERWYNKYPFDSSID